MVKMFTVQWDAQANKAHKFNATLIKVCTEREVFYLEVTKDKDAVFTCRSTIDMQSE